MSPFIEVRHLTKTFPIASRGLFKPAAGAVRAVDDISFDIEKGQTLAVVGESGSGKSTTGRLVMRLLEPTRGEIRFDGVDLTTLDPASLKRARRRQQLIFQDPSSAFNPRMSVGSIIGEPMRLAGSPAAERRERVRELLPLVGLAEDYAERFPHQFSGGQRQRIGIARALALRPEFIVCDEPVSALDVSVQAQVINLLKDLQDQFALTYMFISHDLRVVRHIAHRVAVLYLGRVVEIGDKHAVYRHPQHPYTRLLLSAVPQPNPGARRTAIARPTEVEPDATAAGGCRFATRCPLVMPVCKEVAPDLKSVDGGHQVACHLVQSG